MREYVKSAEHKSYDRNIKIPTDVLVVLYNDNSVWDVPTRFRDIVENEELKNKEV